MSRVSAVLLALLVQVALVTAASAAPAPAAGDSTPRDYVVILRGSPNAESETSSLERLYGFVSRFTYNFAVKGFAARLTDRQADLLSRLPMVESVNEDGPVYAIGTTAIASGETNPVGNRRIGAANTTVTHTAATVNVAVIDTGVDLDHPDLNVVSGTDCIAPGTNADDENGHGTHVAGTIGARNNGSGVIGVAPGTLIYAVRVLDANGSGSWSNVLCGIDWVTANATSRNIKVANMSLGGSSTSFMRTGIRNSTNAGVTYVVAAGNNGANLANYSPANYTEVLAVTAVADTDGRGGALGPAPCRSGEADDRYASFSNYATSTTHKNHTIAAPGVCVHSTTMGGGYASNWSGTSMASPHVAGVAALCLSGGGACAGMTPANAIQKLRQLAAARATAAPGEWFTGDPAHPNGTRYYGNMAWIGDDLGGSPPPTPDFTLSSNPTTRTITQGQATSYAITVSPTGGFNSQVTLSTSALPNGVSASFTTNPTTSSSTLNITTTGSATTGTTGITVTGVGGGLTRTVGVSLTVNASQQATPDFTLSSSPTTRTITQGQATSYAITVNPTGGFNSSVTLSTSALPSGVSASFTTNPTTGSSTLNITTTAGATTGTTNITVTGVGGGLTRTVGVSLTVNAAQQATPDFTLTATPTSRSVPRGTAAEYTITVIPTGGFNSTVSFSVSGLGFGMGSTFTPTSSTTSTTLRVTSSSFWTSRGTRTLTITGTSGGVSRTVQVTLTLT